MKCNKCGENAYTMLDLACDKCGIRLCKNCAQHLKCYVCRIPYCECYGTYCPNDNIHDTLECTLFYIDDRRHDEYWQKHYSNDHLEEEYQTSLKKCVDRWHAFDDDVEFYSSLEYYYGRCVFTSTDENVKNRVKKAGKLSLELAQFIADKLQGHITREYEGLSTVGNEELHQETDQLWQWYIESMKFYTIEEAKEIVPIILSIERGDFWYA